MDRSGEECNTNSLTMISFFAINSLLNSSFCGLLANSFSCLNFFLSSQSFLLFFSSLGFFSSFSFSSSSLFFFSFISFSNFSIFFPKAQSLSSFSFSLFFSKAQAFQALLSLAYVLLSLFSYSRANQG